MRLPATLSLLAVALVTTVASGDEVAVNNLKIAKPAAIRENDNLTITNTTTFTQTAGKRIKKGTRTGTSTIQVLKVKGGKITRANVSRDKVATSGALASVAWAPDTFGSAEVQSFGLDFGDLTRAEIFTADPSGGIVFDAGDGFTDVMIDSIHHFAWFPRGVPMRVAVAGKTFTPGTVVNLGGQDIEIVYTGLTPADWSSLPGGTMTYQHLDGTIASFALTTTVDLALTDGTKVSGELTGTLELDTATASLRSVVLEGDVSSRAGGTFHLVQRISSVLVNNENIP